MQEVERTMLVLMTGLMEIERPVQASRARFWAIIQSSEPLRWRTAKDVVGDRTETMAVTGLLEVIYAASIIFPRIVEMGSHWQTFW